MITDNSSNTAKTINRFATETDENSALRGGKMALSFRDQRKKLLLLPQITLICIKKSVHYTKLWREQTLERVYLYALQTHPHFRPTIMKIRVLIADDHKTFRRALRSLLEMDPDIEVIGEVSSGREACSVAVESRAQVVCMDFRMADMDGVESTRHLIAAMPHIKIIGLSASFEASTESEMLAAGAFTYIAKANAADHLLPAIRAMFALDELLEGRAAKLPSRQH